MQTPISFILDLILDYELPANAQKACRKYIKEFEKMGQPVIRSQQPVINATNGWSITSPQAPSTIALMEKHAMMPSPAVLPPVPAAKRIVGGEVITGNGTKGPKKF